MKKFEHCKNYQNVIETGSELLQTCCSPIIIRWFPPHYLKGLPIISAFRNRNKTKANKRHGPCKDLDVTEQLHFSFYKILF